MREAFSDCFSVFYCSLWYELWQYLILLLSPFCIICLNVFTLNVHLTCTNFRRAMFTPVGTAWWVSQANAFMFGGTSISLSSFHHCDSTDLLHSSFPILSLTRFHGWPVQPSRSCIAGAGGQPSLLAQAGKSETFGKLTCWWVGCYTILACYDFIDALLDNIYLRLTVDYFVITYGKESMIDTRHKDLIPTKHLVQIYEGCNAILVLSSFLDAQ